VIRFLESKSIWPRITRLAEQSAKGMVAVAYFGRISLAPPVALAA
jgi:hypothetical protein